MSVYRELIKRFPDIAEGYYNLGLALETQNRLDEALASYQDCVLRKPDYAEAHFAIGLLLERGGKLAEAVAAYRRAVEAGPPVCSRSPRTGSRAGPDRRSGQCRPLRQTCGAARPERPRARKST